MRSSLVRGVGAIATSSSREQPRHCLHASRNECLASVGEHDHISRLDVRCGMLDQPEIVASRVVKTR